MLLVFKASATKRACF